MNTLTVWNPFRDLDALTNRLLGVNGFGREAEAAKPWTPAVDITEDDSAYVITADLPDVPKEAVKVTVEDGVLTVRGERRWEKKTDNTKVHLVERSYGSFSRSFRLPTDADGAGVSASFTGGVLTLRVPKREESKPREIEVQVS